MDRIQIWIGFSDGDGNCPRDKIRSSAGWWVSGTCSSTERTEQNSGAFEIMVDEIVPKMREAVSTREM